MQIRTGKGSNLRKWLTGTAGGIVITVSILTFAASIVDIGGRMLDVFGSIGLLVLLMISYASGWALLSHVSRRPSKRK